MSRLVHAPSERLTFRWNGREIEAREGDTVAAALHAAGIHLLARSRKRHRPRGLSGSFIASVLARVDGRPNVRLDLEKVRPGLDASIQNVWPSAGFDLLSLAQLLPTRWLHAGFEHNNLISNDGRLYRLWEQSLATLAGVADPPDARLSSAAYPGRKVQADTVVIGGGPAGCAAANAAAARGDRVVLVTRGEGCCRFARALGAVPADLNPRVELLAGMEAFGLYRRGRIVACAPAQHDRAGVVIEARQIVLATGRRSCPPLVPGNELPGLIDAHAAMSLAQDHGVAPGASVFVIGTGAEKMVAKRLAALGVEIVGTAPVDTVRRIIGRYRVSGIETDRPVACDCVIHAGPWRVDPNLLFQTRAEGLFHLHTGQQPDWVEVVGSAAGPDEPVMVGPEPDETTLICPCMDVTWGELAHHVDAGESDVEVLKRVTACGMGPCQGTPCWDLMAAALARLTGMPAEAFGRPSHRDPRRAITVAQAAGLDGLVEAER